MTGASLYLVLGWLIQHLLQRWVNIEHLWPQCVRTLIEVMRPRQRFDAKREAQMRVVMAIAYAMAWPIVLGMSVAAAIKMARILRARAIDDFPQHFIASQKLLKGYLSIAEIEAREIVVDPLNGSPAVPFGHLNAAWRHFKSEHPDQSGFWPFRIERSQPDESDPVSGYATVVGDEIVDEFLIEGP